MAYRTVGVAAALTPNAEPTAGFSYVEATLTATEPLTEVIEFIASYAKAISAPVLTRTTVTSVRSTESGYLVRTDQDDWLCRAIVIASGACNTADVPAFANRVPPSIMQLTAQDYRIPNSSPTVAFWSWVHPRADPDRL